MSSESEQQQKQNKKAFYLLHKIISPWCGFQTRKQMHQQLRDFFFPSSNATSHNTKTRLVCNTFDIFGLLKIFRIGIEPEISRYVCERGKNCGFSTSLDCIIISQHILIGVSSVCAIMLILVSLPHFQLYSTHWMRQVFFRHVQVLQFIICGFLRVMR